MPVSWTTLFRLLVLLLMSLHVFVMYCYARVVSGAVGFRAGDVAASGFFSLAMMIPLAWAVLLPDVPEIVRRHRGRKRWEKGACPSCGYIVAEATGSSCPECGASRGEPAPYSFGWPTALRFAGLAVGAWLLGCVAAQLWILADESAFRREALESRAVALDKPYQRPRAWPMDEVRLFYTARDGVTAAPPVVPVEPTTIDRPE